jgi:apolipoprotein N-acyltransferase
MKNTFRLLLLALLSGILLTFSWPEIGFSPLIFIALVPLLSIEETLLQSGKARSNLAVFGYAYLSFLIWNLGDTWWVKNASFEGALMAFFANSALMAGTFTLFHRTRKVLRSPNSIYYLPVFWLAFEYIHHVWSISWPWLTFGNVFANSVQLIQWYEFTGTSGGSLWVILINCAAFNVLRTWIQDKDAPIKPAVRRLLVGLLIPSLVSVALYFYRSDDRGEVARVAIIQPNVDPYNEKFDGMSLEEQTNKILRLAKKVIHPQTDWLICPETALVGSMDESNLSQQPRIQLFKELTDTFPKLNVLIGAETHQVYMPGQKTVTARKARGGDVYYDAFNTAVMINSRGVRTYHKSKLVPGVEIMPFPWLFKHIESFAIDLGGTTGTLGMQEERSVFSGVDAKQKVAPAVCYESVYGDFMTGYMDNGANFIAIITNDGWWGETPGYKQHLAYARLRAIETRKSIVRSANTGVSCFINQRGDILQAQPYWQEAAIEGEIKLNSERTIYSYTGDLFGLSACFLAIWLYIWSFYLRFKQRRKKA